MSQTDSSRGQGFLRVQGRQNVQVARPGGQGCSLSRWGAAEGVTVGLKPAQAPCWNSVSKEGKSQNERETEAETLQKGSWRLVLGSQKPSWITLWWGCGKLVIILFFEGENSFC